MSREFRLAMLALCAAQLDPTDNPALEASINAWLRGELRLVSEVKRGANLSEDRPAQCPPHALLARPLADADREEWSGADPRRGAICRGGPAARSAARAITTARAATMDLYEVLRELIDATDEAHACFVAVLVGRDFLQDDRRGVRSYQALYFRIWDEVYDRDRENPFSSLVRIAGAA